MKRINENKQIQSIEFWERRIIFRKALIEINKINKLKFHNAHALIIV